MEEDREFKHSCKFCNKRFPCGRSLGGHMRSHMINNNNSAETTKDGKFGKKKLPSVNNGERVSINNNSSLEDRDSWTNNSTQKLVMDTQSDNETAAAAAPNRKRRSKRRRTRYMATANSSSFSVADNNNNNNNGSSSVSEIEQEQSEVAMCLMMLSRDMGPLVCFNSAPQSSDNTSVFSDAGEILKKKKKNKFNSELGSNYKQNSSKFECATCNKIFHSYQALGGHRASHKKIKGCFASKTDHSIETQLISSPPDPTTAIHHSLAAHDYVPKRRHECPICFRVFSSGQALGGHKRSHLVNNVISEVRSNSTIVMEKEKPRPEIPNLLDLNLPASADQEESMKPWWIESSHKHEALVGFHF